MCKKESYVVSAAIVVAVVTMLFFSLTGTAGSLDPAAAPAPTMKTLDQIPPTWSQNLPAAQRFELVLGNAGVLDKETGLVWEQSPSTVVNIWNSTMIICQNKSVGNRKGWRFPTVEELGSLVDPTMSNPSLPSGHPFNDVRSSSYWSATTSANDTAYAWSVYFGNGNVYNGAKTSSYYVWCVRGGQGYDGQ